MYGATRYFFFFLLMVVLPFMPRYIGTLNVTHRDVTANAESTPPSPLSKSPASDSPKTGSPKLTPSSAHAPARTITPLPEVQIDKNRHVSSHFFWRVLISDNPEMAIDYRQETKYVYTHVTHQTPLNKGFDIFWCRRCNNNKL
jgi:hypothetical protein